MELFLLIAIGIAVISFISIALTKPSPVIAEPVPEPAQAELSTDEEAQSRELLPNQKSISSTAEEALAEEEVMASMA